MREWCDDCRSNPRSIAEKRGVESRSRNSRDWHQRRRTRVDARSVFEELRRDTQHVEGEDARAERGVEYSGCVERAANSECDAEYVSAADYSVQSAADTYSAS